MTSGWRIRTGARLSEGIAIRLRRMGYGWDGSSWGRWLPRWMRVGRERGAVWVGGVLARWWALVWVAGLGGTLMAAGSAVGEVAVEEVFQVSRWARSSGLPGNRVRALAVTEDRYLWVGTEAGLVRFDGLTFHCFHRGNTPAFSDDGVTALAAGAGGELWAALSRSVVVLRPGAAVEAVPRMAGVPWSGQGLWPRHPAGVWLRGNVGWMAWERGQRGPGSRPPLEAALAVYEEPDGTVWEALPGSVTRHPPEGGGERVEYRLGREETPEAIRAEFASGGAGTVYLLCGRVDQAAQMGLWELTGSGPREVATGLTPNSLSPLSPVVDGSGTLWYAAGRGWLGRVRGDRFDRIRLPGRPEHIIALALDHEGSLWAGLEASGLLQLRPRRIRSWAEGSGLPAGDVRALWPQGEGGVWVGTSLGLARLDAEGTVHVEACLAGQGIRGLASAGADAQWVGTTRGLFHLESGRLRTVGLPLVVDPGDSAHLGSLKIRALLSTRNGDLWVMAGKAVSVVRAGAREARCVGVMVHLGPTTALEDRAGNVWVASEQGVARFSPATLAGVEWSVLPGPGPLTPGPGSVWLVRPDMILSATNGLSSDHAWGLYEDREGGLWIACDNGLNFLPGGFGGGQSWAGPVTGEATGLFVFTMNHGLPDHRINGLTEDDDGNLWCSTDQGIFAAARAEYEAVARGRASRVQAVHFSSADGLPDEETHGRISHPTVVRTGDGRIWVATPSGLAGFDPRRLLERPSLPRVVLEQVLADDAVVFSTLPGEVGAGLGLGPGPRGAGGPRLAAGQGRVLQFHFTAPGYVAAGQQRFRYQMAGYEADDVWHEAGTRRLAIYTNLDPGAYRFRVQAASHQGRWSDHTAEFGFSLAPHFWQTGAFRVVFGLVLVAGVYEVVAWRLREVRRHERLQRQNAVLRERASIARDIHDDLGPRLTQLALLTERGPFRVPSAGAPLEAAHLAGLARELAGTLDSTLWAVEPSGDTLRHLADYLSDYAQEFVQSAGLGLGLDWPAEVPAWGLTRERKRHLLLVVKEALHNAVKHAQARTVTLGLRVDPEGFTLEVGDDGRGLPDGVGGEPSRGVGAAGGAGLGLSSLRQRAQAVGGRLELVSVPGRGTTVRLWVPRGVFAPEPSGSG